MKIKVIISNLPELSVILDISNINYKILNFDNSNKIAIIDIDDVDIKKINKLSKKTNFKKIISTYKHKYFNVDSSLENENYLLIDCLEQSFDNGLLDTLFSEFFSYKSYNLYKIKDIFGNEKNQIQLSLYYYIWLTLTGAFDKELNEVQLKTLDLFLKYRNPIKNLSKIPQYNDSYLRKNINIYFIGFLYELFKEHNFFKDIDLNKYPYIKKFINKKDKIENMIYSFKDYIITCNIFNIKILYDTNLNTLKKMINDKNIYMRKNIVYYKLSLYLTIVTLFKDRQLFEQFLNNMKLDFNNDEIEWIYKIINLIENNDDKDIFEIYDILEKVPHSLLFNSLTTYYIGKLVYYLDNDYKHDIDYSDINKIIFTEEFKHTNYYKFMILNTIITALVNKIKDKIKTKHKFIINNSDMDLMNTLLNRKYPYTFILFSNYIIDFNIKDYVINEYIEFEKNKNYLTYMLIFDKNDPMVNKLRKMNVNNIYNFLLRISDANNKKIYIEKDQYDDTLHTIMHALDDNINYINYKMKSFFYNLTHNMEEKIDIIEKDNDIIFQINSTAEFDDEYFSSGILYKNITFYFKNNKYTMLFNNVFKNYYDNNYNYLHNSVQFNINDNLKLILHPAMLLDNIKNYILKDENKNKNITMVKIYENIYEYDIKYLYTFLYTIHFKKTKFFSKEQLYQYTIFYNSIFYRLACNILNVKNNSNKEMSLDTLFNYTLKNVDNKYFENFIYVNYFYEYEYTSKLFIDFLLLLNAMLGNKNEYIDKYLNYLKEKNHPNKDYIFFLYNNFYKFKSDISKKTIDEFYMNSAEKFNGYENNKINVKFFILLLIKLLPKFRFRLNVYYIKKYIKTIEIIDNLDWIKYDNETEENVQLDNNTDSAEKKNDGQITDQHTTYINV